MKLTALCFLISLFGLHASNTYSQKTITLKLENVQMSHLLDLIESQTEYHFVYKIKDVDLTRKIQVNARKEKVPRVLDKIFDGTETGYKIYENQIFLTKKQKSYSSTTILANIQETITVTGTITETETGMPVPAANILEKGTSNGVMSDFDGNFSIQVPEDAVLQVSYIGYATQEINVNDRNEIDIVLETDAAALDEIVVLGYSEKRRGEITGAISEIKGDEVAQAPTQNVLGALQGRASGLIINDRGGAPGKANMDILIRGKATLGDNNPMVVIDGIPSSTIDLENLAAADIADISVLKDASAAIYGSRAANGVIVISTKRGKNGVSQLSLNANYGVSTFAIIPKMMNSYQYAEYRTEAENRYNQAPTFSQDDLELLKNGSQPLTHPNTDWYDETYQQYAPQTHINIGASGGTDKVRYYLSGDYNGQEALFKGGDKYSHRYQIRSNTDAQVTKDLHLGVNLYGALREHHGTSNDAASIMGMAIRSAPTSVAKYPNGYPGVGPGGMNPIVSATDKGGWNDTKDKVFKLNLSMDLNMNWITKGLNFKGIASFNYNVENTVNFANIWDEYTYNPATTEYVKSIGSNRESIKYSTLDVTNKVDKQKYYNISLNYKRSFGDHNISSFMAFETTIGEWENLTGYRRDVVSPNKVYLYGASSENQRTNGTASNFSRLSYFGSISYNYERKYLLDFTLRRDGSSKFPKEKRFGTFPSVSAGWVVSDEDFMNGDWTSKWINTLKIRGSYGIMGNDRIPAYQYLAKYDIVSAERGQYYIFGEDPKHYDGFYQVNVPNPDITWEVSKALNIGFDLVSLDNKLTVNFDYFYNKRRNILIARTESVPEYTGLLLPEENLGKVDNYGVEVGAYYQKKEDDWGYGVGGNFSYNRNKIVYMDEAENIPDYRRKEGYPIDSWLVYKTDGIFENQQDVDDTDAKLPGTMPGDIKYVDIDGNGVIEGDDMYRKYTSPTPQIQYGINLDFNYKNYSLNVFIQGQAMAENYIAYPFGATTNQPTYLYDNRWTEGNTNASYPRAYERFDFFNNAPRSDFWLYDASFIRLKNVTFTYNLPTNWTSKISIENASIYLKGFNLWTLSAMNSRMGGKYYDPEMTSETGAYYPQQTSTVVGLSINF